MSFWERVKRFFSRLPEEEKKAISDQMKKDMEDAYDRFIRNSPGQQAADKAREYVVEKIKDTFDFTKPALWAIAVVLVFVTAKNLFD